MTMFQGTKHIHHFSCTEAFSHFLLYPKYYGRKGNPGTQG